MDAYKCEVKREKHRSFRPNNTVGNRLSVGACYFCAIDLSKYIYCVNKQTFKVIFIKYKRLVT